MKRNSQKRAQKVVYRLSLGLTAKMVKEFYIELRGANSGARNLAYHPGSVVEGCVVLEISTPRETKDITMVFMGESIVEWENFRDSEVILNWIYRLWGNGTNSQQLAAGRYEFVFSFQLPSAGLLTSYEYNNGDTKAYIRYSLTATLALSRLWKSNRHVSVPVTVKNIVNVNTPQLSAPMYITHSRNRRIRFCGLSTNGGPIVMSIKTDKGGYCPGESIDIRVNIENNGNRRITAVQASLMQVVKCHAKRVRNSNEGLHGMGGAPSRKGEKHVRCESQCVSWLEGPGGEPGTKINWIKGLLIPNITPNISHCRIIELSYILRVKLLVSWANNLCVNIPIAMGNVLRQREQSTLASANILQPSATNSGFMTLQREQSVSNTNNILQPPATNTGFLSTQRQPPSTNISLVPTASSGLMPYQSELSVNASTNSQPLATISGSTFHPRPPTVNPESAQPPVNSDDDDQQIGETRFIPPSDLVTNYTLDQPPPYDCMVHAHESTV